MIPKKKKKNSIKRIGDFLMWSVLCGSFMLMGIKLVQGKLISHLSLLQMPPVPVSLWPVSLNPEVKMNIARGRNSCSIYYNSQAIKLNMLFIVFLIVNPICVLICRLTCRNLISSPLFPWRFSGCIQALYSGIRNSSAASDGVHGHSSRLYRKHTLL